MFLKIVFLRPQNWSRLRPYYKSTIAAVKAYFHRLCNQKFGRFQFRALLLKAPQSSGLKSHSKETPKEGSVDSGKVAQKYPESRLSAVIVMVVVSVARYCSFALSLWSVFLSVCVCVCVCVSVCVGLCQSLDVYSCEQSRWLAGTTSPASSLTMEE